MIFFNKVSCHLSDLRPLLRFGSKSLNVWRGANTSQGTPEVHERYGRGSKVPFAIVPRPDLFVEVFWGP